MRPGAIMATGRDLDVAINEKAVLGVSTRDGQLAFTRRGDLQVSATGVLQNGSGYVVRGENGQPITLPSGSKVNINPDGSIYATSDAQMADPGVLVGRLMLRDSSQARLVRREDGLFQPEGNPGADITNGTERPSLTPKALEGSNVNAMEIMIKLIDQSRSFEQQIRIIKESKTGDEAGASMLKTSG
jgi:flagellar basal-body rod protein FlgF